MDARETSNFRELPNPREQHNKRWLRKFFTANLAIGVTSLLFLLMQGLIAMDRPPIIKPPIETDYLIPIPEQIIREPVEYSHQTNEQPPSTVASPNKTIPKMDFSPKAPQMFSIDDAVIGGDFNIDLGINFSNGYSQYLPQVQIPPNYPSRALRKGITGYVIVEVTVSKSGRIKDPIIVKSEPKGVFDRAVLQAVRKYRYKPKMVNGEPIEVSGVRYRIDFNLK